MPGWKPLGWPIYTRRKGERVRWYAQPGDVMVRKGGYILDATIPLPYTA